MADFSWAYIDCDNIAVTSYTVPTGSLLYSHGHKAITGSQRFTIDTGSGDSSTWEVRLTGNLDISGTIRSYKFETITYESTNYQGSNTFGNSSADTHKFTGEISGSGPLNIVGAATLESTLNVSGNVGIATSPSAPLHIYVAATTSTIPAEVLRLETNDEGVDMNIGYGPGIDFFVGETGGSDYGGTVAVIREQASDANTDCAMVFHTTTDDQVKAGDREKMRITSTGKVGIGTTTPTHTLTIAGAVSGSSTLDIVGAATLESTLHVTGAITTAAGVTASVGVSASYSNFNSLGINDGGTNSVALGGNGTVSASATVSALNLLANDGGTNSVTISGNGIVNATTRLTSALGITGSSLKINDTIYLNANGNITGIGTLAAATSISSALGITGSSLKINDVGYWNANGNVSSSQTIKALKFMANNGGTNHVTLGGDGTVTATGIISGAIGITGSSFHVNDTIFLNANGNITNVGVVSAAGVTASAGISASYSNFNSLGINDGGTNSVALGGAGTVSASATVSALNLLANDGGTNSVTISGNGIVNATTRLTSALGITGSSLKINDVGYWNANGNLTTAGFISSSVGITGSSLKINDSIILNPNGVITAGDIYATKLSSSTGITGSSLEINDAGIWNANGNLRAAGFISSSVGLTGSSLKINDTIYLNANGNISNVGAVSATGVTASAGVSASYAHYNSLRINDGGTKVVDLKAGNIILGGNIVPSNDNSQNLGATDKRWGNIYTGDLHLKNERGDWTVVEESDYLTVTNNATGQRFKLLMEEID